MNSAQVYRGLSRSREQVLSWLSQVELCSAQAECLISITGTLIAAKGTKSLFCLAIIKLLSSFRAQEQLKINSLHPNFKVTMYITCIDLHFIDLNVIEENFLHYVFIANFYELFFLLCSLFYQLIFFLNSQLHWIIHWPSSN